MTAIILTVAGAWIGTSILIAVTLGRMIRNAEQAMKQAMWTCPDDVPSLYAEIDH